LGTRFYGDIAFWDGLCNHCGSTEEKDVNTAMDRLKAALDGDPAIRSRIMYGTDWHMISALGDWPSYLPDVIANLSKLGDALTMNDLFYANAVRCFGIAGGQKQRIRQFFEGVEGGIAPWIAEA
jgi:hypothetical protein